MTPVSRRWPARLEHLPDAQAFLVSVAEQAELDARLVGRLEIALEEVFVNLCHYAYPSDQVGDIELCLSWNEEGVVVDIWDNGEPFDPSSLAEPDLSASLTERAVGGLGWFMIRQLVSELSCRREQGRNLVSLVMRRSRRAPADPASGA